MPVLPSSFSNASLAVHAALPIESLLAHPAAGDLQPVHDCQATREPYRMGRGKRNLRSDDSEIGEAQ